MPTYQTSPRRTTTFLESRSSSGTQLLVALLRRAGLYTKADRVARCCAEFWAQRCPNRHLARAVPVERCPNRHLARAVPVERCQHRLCPACARWRQGRAVARLGPAVRRLLRRHPDDRWVLITLTVASTREPLQTSVPRLQRHFARLRRSALWKRAIRGAVGSLEVTYHPDTGWHAHLHVLAARRAWCAQRDLAAAWQRASGGEGRVVDVRDRDADVRAGRGATLRYLFKPPRLAGWGPEQVAAFEALARRKLGECYGALRGLTGAGADDDAGAREEAGAGEREACEGTGVGEAWAREGTRGTSPPAVELPCPACGRPLAWARVSRATLEAMMWVAGDPVSHTIAQAKTPP